MSSQVLGPVPVSRLDAPAPVAPVIVSASQQMADILALVERVAARDTKVLVTGESGVGKDLVAREIHMQLRARRRARSSRSTARVSPRRCSSPSCSAT